VLFTKCLSNAGNVRLNEFDMDVVSLIRLEISKKVFHARVNEFMEANKELNLEKTDTVTDADQCLRDLLKTYSSQKL
jgi:hypothetical protein